MWGVVIAMLYGRFMAKDLLRIISVFATIIFVTIF